jgi:BlaR1 peptidase M56
MQQISFKKCNLLHSNYIKSSCPQGSKSPSFKNLTTMIYLLKAHICLSIFLMIYWGFLRKNTFYQLNRAYFLMAIIGSLLLPLLNVSDFVSQHQDIRNTTIVKNIPDLSFQNQEIILATTMVASPVAPTITLNYFDIFQAIFFSGIVVLLCKLIVQFFSIFSLLKISKPFIINQIAVRNLSKDVSPFSFFSYIFININKHSEEDLSEILTHEYTHARQLHSIDVMLVELFCIVFWINPLAWMLRKFLKQNLEFLTDQTVLNQGFDSRHYQYNLLKISGLSPIVVSNNFNFSDLKLRIKMMNRKRSSNLHLVKYFITIPLGAMLILAFNISKAKPFDMNKSVGENVKEMVEAVEFEPSVQPFEKELVTSEELEDIISEPVFTTIIQNEKSITDTIKRLGNYGTANLKIIDSETQKGLIGVQIFNHKGNFLGYTNFQGIVFFDYPEPFVVDSALVNIPKDTIRYGMKSYPIAGGNSYHKIVLRYRQFPDFEIVFKNFKRSSLITFSNEKFELKRDQYDVYFDKEKDKNKRSESISYDRKGNLIITPKTKWFYCKEDVIKELNRTQELELSKRPLYKINGTIVAENYNWNEINIKSILNLDYWSAEDGEKLVPQFGELARNGIYNLNVLAKGFEINIKKIDAKNFSDVPPPPFKNIMEKCTPSADFPPNAMYVVDGKMVDSGYLHKNVQVEDIEKLEVMDTELAKTKYGDKGKKGVILISTKKINKLEEK